MNDYVITFTFLLQFFYLHKLYTNACVMCVKHEYSKTLSYEDTEY